MVTSLDLIGSEVEQGDHLREYIFEMSICQMFGFPDKTLNLRDTE